MGAGGGRFLAAAFTLVCTVSGGGGSVEQEERAEIYHSGGSSPRRPRLSCSREWTRTGAPLRCWLQLDVAAESSKVTRPMAAVARVCTSESALGATCRRQTFSIARPSTARGCKADRMLGRCRSGAKTAEGSFLVSLETAIDLSKALALQVVVEVARLRLAASVPLEEAVPTNETLHGEAVHSETALAELDEDGQAHMLKRLRSDGFAGDFYDGALRWAAPLSGFMGTPSSFHAARRVRVELGSPPPEGSFPGLRPEPADLLVVLEPRLSVYAEVARSLHPDHAKYEGGPSRADTRILGVALPLAVGVGADDDDGAVLGLSSIGPVRAEDAAETEEESLRNTCGAANGGQDLHRGDSKSCQKFDSEQPRERLSWKVPVVPLRWVLDTLVPSLAPNVSEVCLVVRRSAALGSAWRVLSRGTTRTERAKLSALAVEWGPADPEPCMEVAQAILAEGFTRRGPIFCEDPRQVELSFKQSPTQGRFLEHFADRDVQALPLFASEVLSKQSLVFALQHRFPVARVSDGATEDHGETSMEYAVQVPDYYDVWVEANSGGVIGLPTLRPLLDSGSSHGAAFLLSLEARPQAWVALLAGDEVGRQQRPPGWAHERHMVVPVNVFPKAGSRQNASHGPPEASLSWAIEALLGTHDVSLLVLRDPFFDVSPWLTAASGVGGGGRSAARRFRRVRIEGGDSDAAAAACMVARRLAERLGYALLSGRCPRPANTEGDGGTLDAEGSGQALAQLTFERLG